MPSATPSIDLDAVRGVIGDQSFARGAAYAHDRRVLSVSWNPGAAVLSGTVLGGTGHYSTAAFFDADDEGTVGFGHGECSCSVGYDCKHVAALTVAAVSQDRDSRHDASPSGDPDASPPGDPDASPPGDPNASPPGDPDAQGTALAIELALVSPEGDASPRPPRLQARLMRPDGAGGWVNGALAWSALAPWNLRDTQYRPDQLEVAREFAKVQSERPTARPRYRYAAPEVVRALDLTDWHAGELWPLLERAASLGMVTVHADGGLAQVPRHRRGELVLDVRETDDGGALVVPELRMAGGELHDGFVPRLFLGVDGHGLVTCREAGDEHGASLQIVRLKRGTPQRLREIVLDGNGLVIAPEERDRFGVDLAPGLRALAPLKSSDSSFDVPEVSGPQLLLRAVHDDAHRLRAAWRWVYRVGDGDHEVALDIGTAGPGIRDLEAERELLDSVDLTHLALEETGLLDWDGRPGPGTALLDGFETVEFLTGPVRALQGRGDVRVELTGDLPDYRDVDDSLEVGIATRSIPGDRDWFDLDVTISVEGRELPFAEVFAALARGQRRMLLPDGAHFALAASELDTLRALIEEARKLGEGSTPGSLRISRYQAGLWRDLVRLGVVREQAEGWQRAVEGLLGLEELKRHDLPAGLRADLRPYQREGFDWLATLWDLGLGGVLADDMGLGKTLQALALIAHTREQDRSGARAEAGNRRPFLVVAPTSVVPNWATEVARFTPGLEVRAVVDTLARAGRSIEELTDGADVVVTTYTLLRIDSEHYGALEWAGLILDEAQAVKNHNAKTHAVVRRLEAPFKLAITGTPLENNVIELWSLLSITCPGLFPDPGAFKDFYANPIERNADADRLALLRRRIRPLLKRRSKELVASELPAKQEQVLEVELLPRHRKLYDTYLQRERQRILGLLEDFDANRFSILTAITRLRQLSLHPGLVEEKHRNVPAAKLEALTEQIEDVIGGGHRALVFSQFTSFLALVRERLDAEGIEYCYLDGRTRRRGDVIKAFKEGEAPVFLISLKAGGFGLNLTEADYCFLLDPWWNPATEAQAIDRTHRIGQTRQVMVYRLVSKGTIEEKVVALARRKAELFSSVLDDGDLFSTSLSAEDIRGLLG